MGHVVEKNNFTSLETLAADLGKELQANGFALISKDDQNTDLNIGDTAQRLLFRPDQTVDPLAPADPLDVQDGEQPWLLFIVANDEDDTLDFYAFTPTQLILGDLGEVRVAVSGNTGPDISVSGFMFKDSQTQTGGQTNHFFSYEQWGFENIDEEAVPLSYFLTITDHGLAFTLWAESYDRAGDKFGWWCIQRMVDAAGAPVVDGKAPLFCVFSHDGGGGSDLNTVDANGILKFVVRESDVNAPTRPVSAAKDTADSARIINSVQQTSIYENGQFIINFPRSLNTQRYSYPHELDIIAYASADVTSQYATHEVTVYSEAQAREYRAMNANHEDNKGMRIYFQTTGMGIDVARP
jgi:hypothetical protein